jgi:hypothetical protein
MVASSICFVIFSQNLKKEILTRANEVPMIE